jgi:hypothetical protein
MLTSDAQNQIGDVTMLTSEANDKSNDKARVNHRMLITDRLPGYVLVGVGYSTVELGYSTVKLEPP